MTIAQISPDQDGDPLTWTISVQPLHGSASLTPSGNSTVVHFDPDQNYNGDDAFVVTVSDGYAIDDITVEVCIAPVEDAPIVTLGSIPLGALEGASVLFTGSFTDPDEEAPYLGYTTTWAFGDGSTSSGSLTPSHAYMDNGSYPVTLTVTDPEGNITSDSLTVEIGNIAPTLGVLPSGVTIRRGESYSLSVSFTDPGLADTHTISVDWGDSTTTGASVDQSGNTATAAHSYSARGIFIVTLTLTDDDGGQNVNAFQITGTHPDILLPLILRGSPFR